MGEIMNTEGSAERLRGAPGTSLTLVVVPFLALAAACGSGAGTASHGASTEGLIETARPTTQYSFEFIDVPGSVRTIVWGINNSGVAVGVFTDGNGASHGFTRSRNGVDDFDFPGSSSTSFLDVNDVGTAVGWFNDASGVQHGFMLAPDMTSTVIDVPGAANTYVGSINNRGDMVGSYGPTIDEGTGFLLQDGRFTTLTDPPNAVPETTLPLGINDARAISGSFTDAAGAQHGFVLLDGTYTVLDPLGSNFADFGLTKINDLGNAVGSNGAKGFVVSARTGRFSAFSCPGGFAIRARGINNRGQISGGCRTGPGAPFVGFIATPVDQ
jgi:hypothetical protein